jgi:hypothetical protein
VGAPADNSSDKHNRDRQVSPLYNCGSGLIYRSHEIGNVIIAKIIQLMWLSTLHYISSNPKRNPDL